VFTFKRGWEKFGFIWLTQGDWLTESLQTLQYATPDLHLLKMIAGIKQGTLPKKIDFFFINPKVYQPTKQLNSLIETCIKCRVQASIGTLLTAMNTQK